MQVAWKHATYTMSRLAATLQPNARTRSNRSRRKTNTVITPNLHHPAGQLVALACFHDPLIFPGKPALTGRSLGEKMPCVLQHVDMSGSLVARRANDKVHLQLFFPEQRPILGTSDREHRNVEAQGIALVLDSGDVPPGQNAMRPLLLIRPKCPFLVVHNFEQVLDELQPDNAVVGGAGIREEVRAVCRGLGINSVDKLGVEDAIDTVNVSRRPVSHSAEPCGHTYNGESSLGLRNSDRITM